MPQIFVSYNREDGEGGLVAEFVRDFCDEVARKTGWPKHDIAYLDRNVPVGTAWQQQLVGSIHNCGLLFALYSPRFFDSGYCGREWTLFNDRILTHFSSCEQPPPLIMPILWEARNDLVSIPQVAEALQFDDGRVHPTYVERGLRQIIQHKVLFRAEYWAILGWLATRSIDTLRRWNLPRTPPGPINLSSVRNAFAMEFEPPQVGPGGIQTKLGPKHAHFAIFAGTESEMRRVRTAIDGYGHRPEDWRPYLPKIDDPAALYAMEVARRQRIVSHFASPQDLIRLIEDSRKSNNIVVVLVDPWSIGLEHYKRELEQYDQILALNTGVLVLWNSEDTETARSHYQLHADVLRVFDNHSKISRPELFVNSLDSLEDFQRELHRLLVKVQKLIFSNGDVAKIAKSARPMKRPDISGTGLGNV